MICQRMLSRVEASLTAVGIAKGAPLAVGVSGGSDSMALVLLLAEWARDHRGTITAITVDHALRQGSAQEAHQVARWMKARDIPHHTLTWQRDEAEIGGNLQAAARQARYGLLSGYCAEHSLPYLAIGHTKDDYIETVGLREQRNAGLYGLAGMSARRKIAENLILLRPLLPFTREELRDFLQNQGQEWIDDPSNDNDAFDRIALRNKLRNEPEEKHRLFALGVENARCRIADEMRVNKWFTHALQHQGGQRIQLDMRHFAKMTEFQQSLAIGEVLRRLGGAEYAPRYHKLRRLCEAILHQNAGKQMLAHCQISWENKLLTLMPENKEHGFAEQISRKSLVEEPFSLIYV